MIIIFYVLEMLLRKIKVKVSQLRLTLCDPLDYPSMEFSRPEYRSG